MMKIDEGTRNKEDKIYFRYLYACQKKQFRQAVSKCETWLRDFTATGICNNNGSRGTPP
jgi:hypothetical protein